MARFCAVLMILTGPTKAYTCENCGVYSTSVTGPCRVPVGASYFCFEPTQITAGSPTSEDCARDIAEATLCGVSTTNAPNPGCKGCPECIHVPSGSCFPYQFPNVCYPTTERCDDPDAQRTTTTSEAFSSSIMSTKSVTVATTASVSSVVTATSSSPESRCSECLRPGQEGGSTGEDCQLLKGTKAVSMPPESAQITYYYVIY